MKKSGLLLGAALVLAAMPALAQTAPEPVPPVTSGTTGQPVQPQAVPPQTPPVTEPAAPQPTRRDAITGQPVPTQSPSQQQEESLRDKVRDKMKR